MNIEQILLHSILPLVVAIIAVYVAARFSYSNGLKLIKEQKELMEKEKWDKQHSLAYVYTVQLTEYAVTQDSCNITEEGKFKFDLKEFLKPEKSKLILDVQKIELSYEQQALLPKYIVFDYQDYEYFQKVAIGEFKKFQDQIELMPTIYLMDKNKTDALEKALKDFFSATEKLRQAMIKYGGISTEEEADIMNRKCA